MPKLHHQDKPLPGSIYSDEQWGILKGVLSDKGGDSENPKINLLVLVGLFSLLVSGVIRGQSEGSNTKPDNTPQAVVHSEK